MGLETGFTHPSDSMQLPDKYPGKPNLPPRGKRGGGMTRKEKEGETTPLLY